MSKFCHLRYRLRAAWLAFHHARTMPTFAVIYDGYEGLDPEAEDPLKATMSAS